MRNTLSDKLFRHRTVRDCDLRGSKCEGAAQRKLGGGLLPQTSVRDGSASLEAVWLAARPRVCAWCSAVDTYAP